MIDKFLIQLEVFIRVVDVCYVSYIYIYIYNIYIYIYLYISTGGRR